MPRLILNEAVQYAITDRSHYGQTEPARDAGLLEQAERLARSGVDFIQLREKDLSAQELLRLSRAILEILRSSGSRTRLLVNSRADVAAAAAAHGLHLPSGEQQLTPGQARRIFEAGQSVESQRQAIVSVSCHDLDEVRRARAGGADLILFGPVFGKTAHGTLVTPAIGLAALSAACAAAGNVPVLALGGVTRDNSADCLAAGAKGIAAIRLFL